MSEEKKPDAPADEEFNKADPKQNPRNQSLAEIAARVAEKHKTDAAETAPVVGEDNQPLPAAAPAVDPDPTPSASETVAPAAAEVPPAPVAAPAGEPDSEALDPSKEYEIEIDGAKVKVPGSKIIDAGFRTFKKETAADYRLKVASNLLEEARRTQGATREGAPPVETSKPTALTDQQLAEAVQFGTPEQAAAAMKEIRGRSLDPEELMRKAAAAARHAAADETRFQEARSFVEKEYGDLLSDPYLRRLFFLEENRRRAPVERGGEASTASYKDLYDAIGKDLRKRFGPAKSASSSPAATTPSGSVQARTAMKAAAAPAPKLAGARLTEVSEQAKPKTNAEVIAAMAASRGKNRLAAPRTPVKG